MDRPGLSKCNAKRSQAHHDVTQWFQRWCAAKKLSGESPVAVVDLLAFPDRYRDRLLTALSRDLCGDRRDDLLAHG